MLCPTCLVCCMLARKFRLPSEARDKAGRAEEASSHGRVRKVAAIVTLEGDDCLERAGAMLANRGLVEWQVAATLGPGLVFLEENRAVVTCVPAGSYGLSWRPNSRRVALQVVVGVVHRD